MNSKSSAPAHMSFHAIFIFMCIQSVLVITGCSRAQLSEMPVVEICFVVEANEPDYETAMRLEVAGEKLRVRDLESFHIKKARRTIVQYTETMVDCYVADEELPRFQKSMERAVGRILVIKIGS